MIELHTYNALEDLHLLDNEHSNEHHEDKHSPENTTLKKTESTSTGMGINYEQAELIKSILGINDIHVANIMILSKNVFMLSQEDVIDKFKLQLILEKGYSRIPVYANKDKNDIKGNF